MSNQASEDDELLKKIDSIMPQCGEIDCTTCTQRHEGVLALLRTEKLKLLAAVREQSQEYELNMHGFYDKDISDRITAVDLEVLTKLEAEL
jgi:hypothetical protein